MALLDALLGSGGTFGSRLGEGIEHPGGLLAQTGIGNYANQPGANTGLIGMLRQHMMNQGQSANPNAASGQQPNSAPQTQPGTAAASDPWAGLRTTTLDQYQPSAQPAGQAQGIPQVHRTQPVMPQQTRMAATPQSSMPQTPSPVAQQPIQHADLASMVSAWLQQHQVG